MPCDSKTPNVWERPLRGYADSERVGNTEAKPGLEPHPQTLEGERSGAGSEIAVPGGAMTGFIGTNGRFRYRSGSTSRLPTIRPVSGNRTLQAECEDRRHWLSSECRVIPDQSRQTISPGMAGAAPVAPLN